MKRKYVISIGAVISLLLMFFTVVLANSLDQLASQGVLDTPVVEVQADMVTLSQGMLNDPSGMLDTSPDSSLAANCTCPMMGGMADSGMSGMASTGMSGTTEMGMMNSETAGTNGIPDWLGDPWLMLGWVLLGLVVLAILFGIGFGIYWIVRRSRTVPPAGNA